MKMLFKEKEDSKLLINLYCVKETQGGHSVVKEAMKLDINVIGGILSGHVSSSELVICCLK